MESIERFVADQLTAWEVPGCAIACVRDGDVVLTKGWGRRDTQTGDPVTENTLFAIGSVTKAFTVTTVGALVDDGLLDWERPLRDYVPEVRLHDPVVTERLSIVDLLSHRSGLPRHDLAWVGHPDRSRADLVRRLRFRPHLGTMDLSLAHRHYETFDLEWHELGDQSHIFPLMFLSDPGGDITALTVPFEPSLGPLRFDRLPDAPARDPEVLRRLCGTYVMGPIEVVVALQGDDALTVSTPGAPPLELQPTRGLRFEIKGQPGITAEFELDQAGTVVRLVAQPLGIFHPKA